MTLRFASLVSLLEAIESNRHLRAATESRATSPDERIIKDWFAKHAADIPRHGPSALALLSHLLPERLPHRVYDLREYKLIGIVSRALGLGVQRQKRLREWQKWCAESDSGVADFAECVAGIMAEAETASDRHLTLLDVDEALVRVASVSRFAGPRMGSRRGTEIKADVGEILQYVIRSLRSVEAKWFVRLILKDLRTVQMPERILLKEFHFLLPDLLAMQNDLEAAVKLLGSKTFVGWPSNPDYRSVQTLKAVAAAAFEPQMGVMLTRQPYDKARSIKHCLKMADRRKMSVERKYDGEYCQIHVTRDAKGDYIQIFSKSGKDSTNDREALHPAIRKALRFDGEKCKIQYRCILEGELIIWNYRAKQFEPFHKIRRYVKHGGKFLGAEKDSPRKAEDVVMIVFYDMLLLDKQVLATQPHEKRRSILKDVVERIPGVSDICERILIDFGKSTRGPKRIRERFASSIRSNWEGLVLKPSEDPYYSWTKQPRSIKLKKDYLRQLGDSADLCIIGARQDSRFPSRGIWNVFYLACLENKEAVQRFEVEPSFTIIDKLTTDSHCIPPSELTDIFRVGQACQEPYQGQSRFDIDTKISFLPPTVLFKMPFVVECLGAGYVKQSNCTFWTLRFPRITKVHYDRSITETVSFAELQEAAIKSNEVEHDDEAYETLIKQLVAVDGIAAAAARARNVSQSTTSPSQTPRSTTTASISPVMARRRASTQTPVLVRTDTSELTAIELRQRQSTSQTTTTTSTKSPSVVGSRGSAEAGASSFPSARPLASPAHLGILRSRRPVDDVGLGQSASKRRKLSGMYQLLSVPQQQRVEIDLTQTSPSPILQRAQPIAQGTMLVALQQSAPQAPSMMQPQPSPSQRLPVTSAPTSSSRKARARSSRNPRGLLKTPPWCHSSPSSRSGAIPDISRPVIRAMTSLSPQPRRRAFSIDGVSDSPERVRQNVSRRPLAEIPAASPRQSAPTSQLSAGRDPARTPGKEKGVPESFIKWEANAIGGATMGHSAAASEEDEAASLLTPPATEEAERREREKRRKERRAAAEQDTRTAQFRHADAEVMVHPVQDGIALGSSTNDVATDGVRRSQFFLTSAAIPILLTHTLHPSESNSSRKHMLGVHNFLVTSPAMFTYSSETFLSRLLAARYGTTDDQITSDDNISHSHRPEGTVLVDSSDHSATANEIWDLALEVVRLLNRRSPNTNHRHVRVPGMMLEVYEYRALQTSASPMSPSGAPAGPSAVPTEASATIAPARFNNVNYLQGERAKHESFICAIEAGGNIQDEKGRPAARVIWR